MKINDAQRVHLMADLWPAACAGQGWNKGDRALRMRVLSEAVGRELASASDIGRVEEFSRVKAHLGMLAGNLNGALKVNQPTLQKKPNYLHVIANQKKCLALYLEGSVEAYVDAVIRDKFNRGRRSERISLSCLSNEPGTPFVRGGRLIEPPSQVEQLMMTLAARLNDLRKEAGDSLHEMNTKAGTPCRSNCKKCAEGVAPVTPQAADELEPVGVVDVEEAWNPEG